MLFNLHYLDKKSADDAENMATIIIDKIYNPLVDNSKTDSKGRKGKAVNVFQGLIIDPTSVQIRGATYKSNYFMLSYQLTQLS